MLVILLVNLNFDAGLVNGSQGTIVGFKPHNKYNFPELNGKYKTRKTRLISEFSRHSAVEEWPIV